MDLVLWAAADPHQLSSNPILALLALTAMEIILGIDNIVFLSIVTGRLPPHQQSSARLIGLALAMLMRIGLLLTISWVMQLKDPIFTLSDVGGPLAWLAGMKDTNEVSGRDLILLGGGLFLIAKSVTEIHEKLESKEHAEGKPVYAGYFGVLVQIVLLDIIFSLDSVITAVGMTDVIWVMIVAVVLAVAVMMIFAGPISRFVMRHPTLKMLALSFLILIGVMLVAEGIGQHIDKGYIYFAMAFALGVEFLNLRLRSHASSSTSPPAST
ncbi:MAG: TerC family protein [Pirellulales bacterium]